MSSPGDLPERPLDLIRLLEALARHGVDYVVVGGVAVQAHGHRRTTKDLDVIPAPEPENYERLSAALEELSARQRGVDPGSVALSPADPERLRIAAIIPPLTTIHGELRILNAAKGAPAYEDLRRRALTVELDGIPVTIAALEDLIRMKRASGRPADLEDIAVLTAIEDAPPE